MSKRKARTPAKYAVKIGDRVIALTHPLERKAPRPGAMRGTVVAVGRPQVTCGGGNANVTVRWDNGHVGRMQDFTLMVIPDEGKASSAQLDREIAEALVARSKRPLTEVIEAMNGALKRFPDLLKAQGWDFGGDLLEAAGIRGGATFDEDVLELRDYPGVVIDLYETRRARRVVTR